MPLPYLRLALCAAALLAPAWSYAQCAETIGSFEVSSAQIAPELNTSVPRAELTRVAEYTRPGLADGLTDVQFGYRIDLKPGEYHGGCPTTHVVARLVADTAVVYLAREVGEPSCRYRAVMDHELLHVQIGQRALDKGAEDMRARLRKLPASFGGTGMRPWLQQQVTMALDLVRAQYERQNTELDGPAEGERLANICDTSIKFQVGARVHQLQD